MKCYLCGRSMEFFLEKNIYEIYRCPSCGLKSTDFKQEYETFVAGYYSKGYFTGEREYGAYADYQKDKTYILKNMQKFLTKIHTYKSGGRLLDVGCAMGFFVELAMKNGFDAYGFDPSDYAVGEAKKTLHGRIQKGMIQGVDYKEKSFDVITLFDVVEHLSDPVGNIRKLTRFLKDDGIMVFATGNSDSLTANILKRRWTFYTPPQHLHFFSPNTFTLLLQKIKLTQIERFSVGKWLSLRYVLNLARSNGESAFAGWLHAFVYTRKIGGIPLYLYMADNMVVIAKKQKFHEESQAIFS